MNRTVGIWGGIALPVWGLALLFLTGCAQTLQYPPFPDQAKRVEDPAKARIYLIRKEKVFGSAVGLQFYGSEPDAAVGPLAGAGSKMRLIGEVGPGSYLCWEESPRAFKYSKIEHDRDSVETINLKAGNVYYLRAYLHSGWTTVTARVKQIDEKEGQELLKHCEPPKDYLKK